MGPEFTTFLICIKLTKIIIAQRRRSQKALPFIVCIIVKFIELNLLCVYKCIKRKSLPSARVPPPPHTRYMHPETHKTFSTEIFIAYETYHYYYAWRCCRCWSRTRPFFRRTHTEDLSCWTSRIDERTHTDTHNKKRLRVPVYTHITIPFHILAHFAVIYSNIHTLIQRLWACGGDVSGTNRNQKTIANRRKSFAYTNWFIVIVLHYVSWIINGDNHNLFTFSVSSLALPVATAPAWTVILIFGFRVLLHCFSFCSHSSFVCFVAVFPGNRITLHKCINFLFSLRLLSRKFYLSSLSVSTENWSTHSPSTSTRVCGEWERDEMIKWTTFFILQLLSYRHSLFAFRTWPHICNSLRVKTFVSRFPFLSFSLAFANWVPTTAMSFETFFLRTIKQRAR